MITYCPRCGAQYREELRGEWFESGLRCHECGLTVANVPAMLAPADPDDEVEYDLGEWEMVERGEATNALQQAEIPYRWEPHFVLVVPSVAEEEVDQLLDELDPVVELVEAVEVADGGDELADDEDGVADEELDEDEVAGDELDGDEGEDADEEEDEDEIDGGEEAQAAMADLFVAADRLQHDPVNPELALAVMDATATVTTSPAPYGIQRPVWRRIQDLASSVVDDLGEEEAVDEEMVAADARALRDYLRDLV